MESRALYNVLENDVIPCFYERRNGEAPDCWLKKMKASMKMAMEHFCSLRMVAEYRDRFYLRPPGVWTICWPTARRRPGAVTAQAQRLRSLWPDIRIEAPVRDQHGPFRVGESFRVTAVAALGELRPDEVEVALFHGTPESVDALKSGSSEPMTVDTDLGGGRYIYACTLVCRTAGRYGFTARVTPRGDERIKFTPPARHLGVNRTPIRSGSYFF